MFQTSSNTSTALRMQDRGGVSIFGAGYPSCDLAAWVTNAPKMGGGIQGGRLPLLAHDFRRKSSVFIPFVPAGAGKGRRGLAQTLSRTRKSGGGMERSNHPTT